MTLRQFDVSGKGVSEEDAERTAKEGDPQRSLVRYQPDGRELFVSTRINLPLLRTAISLPVLLLKPSSRQDGADERGELLTVQGSRRNYELRERIWEKLDEASVPACYLADQHGAHRRDFYFVTEDVAGLERVAHGEAEALSFDLATEQHSLAAVAPTILVTETIGELGIEVAADARIRPTRFEFWGAEASLTRLRAELERRGYQYLGYVPYLNELQMIRPIRIDGPGFLAVLQEIVPLARSLGCSYLGTETIEGFDQFALTRPLPERYAAAAARGVFGRLFGGKRA